MKTFEDILEELRRDEITVELSRKAPGTPTLAGVVALGYGMGRIDALKWVLGLAPSPEEEGFVEFNQTRFDPPVDTDGTPPVS